MTMRSKSGRGRGGLGSSAGAGVAREARTRGIGASRIGLFLGLEGFVEVAGLEAPVVGGAGGVLGPDAKLIDVDVSLEVDLDQLQPIFEEPDLLFQQGEPVFGL